GLELRLTRAASADAAAEPRQPGRGSDEARHQVFELRELDLELAFAGASAAREDVENELRPIEHRDMRLALEIPELRRRQLVVEDDEIDAELGTRGRQRVDFASAEKGRGIGSGPLLKHAQHDVRAGR